MSKRLPPTLIGNILEWDTYITKKILTHVLQYPSFKSLRNNGKYLEVSCNGIVWLATWLAFIWIIDNANLYQMQLNMLFGLILDIIIVAVLKAFFRRRRPTLCEDMLTLGPDKFSFPSGHASRSTFILLFFISLSPVNMIWWMPISAWCASICLSRLVMQRHYLLDVIVGIFLGTLEAFILKVFWINQDTAVNIISYLSNDNLPGPSD